MRCNSASSLVFLLLIVLAHGSGAHAAADADPIDAEIKRQNIPGLAVVLVREGKTDRLSTYGMANLELGVPVSGDTVFQAGSTAKQFTALGVLILEAEGRLRVTDRLSQHLADVPQEWGDITLQHIMAHLSGLAEDIPDVDWQANLTSAELKQAVFRTPKYGAAGSKWGYSNAAYILLGMVVEKVTGASYHALLEDRIFRPLGMHATRQISEAELVPNRADGYERVIDEPGAPLRNQRWVSQTFNSTADGSTYITPKDFAKYLASLDVPPPRLAAHYRELFQPRARITPQSTIAYGYGWFLTELNGMPVQYHSGSWQGFRVNLIRYPSRKASLIIMANSDIPARQQLIDTVVAELLPGLPVPTEW
jgi:D-alanyl-D-alanine carboxypeptidase